ncbi:putative HTH-type transcriptional regulator [Planctomycetaceae bacterium]|nr:putative HTH-type transcriptional regulator [Planctomycetaceae bacterium]
MTMKNKANNCCEPPTMRAGLPFDKDLAKLAKALGHPVRVRIVQLLLKRDSCMCGDIVDQLPLAQSTVSQHLKVLKEAGIIFGQTDGPAVCYCVNQQALTRLGELLNHLA